MILPSPQGADLLVCILSDTAIGAHELGVRFLA